MATTSKQTEIDYAYINMFKLDEHDTFIVKRELTGEYPYFEAYVYRTSGNTSEY